MSTTPHTQRPLEFRLYSHTKRAMGEPFTIAPQTSSDGPQTILQYTGNLDKNGTKIFEGDIVEFQDKDGNHSGFMEVRYTQNGFGYHTIHPPTFTPTPAHNPYPTVYHHYPRDLVKIVGNIYQNSGPQVAA